MTEKTTVHLVPHTHWDREWYEPFQVFRMRLIDLVDEVLEHLESEPDFRFTLDGQLATIDDYLRIRPESEPRIRRAVMDGRLAVGPWLILMDEFLVAGETLVRNLELGWQRARDFGGAMPIGYLPDMFGHVAQMPQILQRAGISDAVVWRGVPAAVREHAFRWRAPDGSEVRAEFLPGSGYSSGAYLLDVPGKLAARIATFHHAMQDAYGDRDVLAMYGTDHTAPVRDLAHRVRDVNRADGRYELRIDTLPDYLAASRAGDDEPGARSLLVCQGELRSSARANLLMGVTSARIDVKAAMARAEWKTARLAEPLHALHGDGAPDPFLALAWRRIVESSAHDSICGCSIDHVVEKVISRLEEAEQISEELATRTAARIARECPRGAWVVLNPSPVERRGYVDFDAIVPEEWREVALELPDGRRVATQEVSRNEPLLDESEVSGGSLVTFLNRRIHGRELFGRLLNEAALDPEADPPTVTLLVDQIAHHPWFDVDEVREKVAIAASDDPQRPWRVRIRAAPRRRLQAMVPVPPLGWTAARTVEGNGEVEHPVRAVGTTLDNGRCTVSVAADGTLAIDGSGVALKGVGRLVDGGEFGDTYNHAPPRRDRLISDPVSVSVTATARGPVRGELVVTRTYEWPAAVLTDGSAREARTEPVAVAMHVELRSGEPFVRIRLSFENRSRDHRLRFHVPLPRPSSHSSAEGQFAVVERGLIAEGGYGEVALPTFPAQGWVDAGDVAILLEHPLEYELVEGGRELALTVLRATGLLSRNDNPYREDPAGPEKEVPGAQCLGPWEIGFAVLPHRGSWCEADVVGTSELYRHGCLIEEGSAAPLGPLHAGTGLALDGAGTALTALRRAGDELELRLVREHPEDGRVRLGPGLAGAREVDLLGNEVQPLTVDPDGWLALDVRAWEIRTLRVRRATA